MKILLWPHPTLKKLSEELTAPPDKALVEEMFALMKFDGGVGLSAIQVGIPQQLIVASIAGVQRTFVNASLSMNTQDPLPAPMSEGCLSTPGHYGMVERFPRVTVRSLDENFEAHEETFTGLWAQMIQHEVDHGLGIMYTSYLKNADASRIMGEMMKLKRKGGR